MVPENPGKMGQTQRRRLLDECMYESTLSFIFREGYIDVTYFCCLACSLGPGRVRPTPGVFVAATTLSREAKIIEGRINGSSNWLYVLVMYWNR